MDYANVLKNLIEISGLTAKYIATYIGYDNSYISKWTTGKNVPSPKMHYYINSKLADLFSRSIVNYEDLYKITQLFEKKVLLVSKEVTKSYILCLLQDAYFTSAKMFNFPELTINDKDVFIGWDEIHEAIRIISNQIIINPKNDIRIINTNALDIKNILQKDLFDIFYVLKEVPVKFLLFFYENEKFSFIQSFEDVLFSTLQFGFYDIEIVLVSEKPKNSMLIIENEVAMFFEYYDPANPKLMTTTTDKKVVEYFSKYYNDISSKSILILRSSNNLNTEYSTLRNMLNTDDEIIVYLAFFSGLLISDELNNHLIHKHKISSEHAASLNELRKLYLILLKNIKIKLIISEEMIHTSVLNRKINFCGKQITLTNEEAKDYVTYLREFISELDNIEYYSYNHSNKGPVIKFSDYKVTFIANRKNTLMIRDFSMVNSNSKRYISYTYPDLSCFFYEFIEDKYLNNYYRKMEKEDFIKLLDRSLLFFD